MIDKAQYFFLKNESLNFRTNTSSGKQESEALRSNLENDSSSSEEAVLTEITKLSSVNLAATASGIQNFVERAKEALSAIEALREEQYALTQRGSVIAQGEELSDLNSQFSSVQTQINSVAQDATYRGINVLQGGTFSIRNDEQLLNVVTGIGNANAVTASTGVSLSSPAAAYTATTTLQNAVKSASLLTVAAEDSQESALVSSEKATAQNPELNGILSLEAAEKVAQDIQKQIADKVSSSSDPKTSTEELIELSTKNLKSERVLELLSD